MKRISTWLVWLLLAMIIVTNLPIINSNFMLMLDGKDHFRYSNNNASYTSIDGLSFKNGAFTPKRIERFIEETNPQPENRELFRLYRINPLCFWRWSYYFGTSSNFKFKSWEDIKPNRLPYDPKNRWQDF